MARKKQVVLGIDPGVSGFIAVMDLNSTSIIETTLIKNIERIHEKLKYYNKNYSIVCIALEKVTGGAAQNEAAAGKLMQNFGQLEGYFKALGLYPKILFVTPTKWQRYIRTKLDGAKNEKTKEQSKIVATKLARKGIRNHNEADAICLAGYAALQVELGTFIEADVTIETPKVETPKVETPKVETPKVETPKVETPKVETKSNVFKFKKSKTPDVDDLL